MKRLGIFVFFDPQGIVDDYVVVLLKALRENLSRLVVISNTKLDATARATLDQNADAVFERENQGFDAAGFKAGMVTYCGWDEVQRYDEVVLINDTFFGPIHSFTDMFAEMSEKEVDFWGMSAHYAAEDGWHRVKYGYIPNHIQTFFVAFRKKMVCTDAFRSYWDHYDDSLNDYVSVVTQHEVTMTKYFEDFGFKWAVYADTERYHSKNRQENFNICFSRAYRMIKDMKFPVVKKKVLGSGIPYFFRLHDLEEPADAMRYIYSETEYDTGLIWDNVLRLYSVTDLYHTLHLSYILPSIPVEVDCTKRAAIVYHLINPFFVDLFCNHAARIASSIDVYMIPATEEIKQILQSTLKSVNNITLMDTATAQEEMLNFILCCKELAGQYTYLGFVHDVFHLENAPVTVAESEVFNYLQNVANDEAYVKQVIFCFEQNPRMGVLGTPFPIHHRGFGTYGNEWGNWFNSVCDLAKELSLSCNLAEEKNPFMITGAFWCRTDALRGIWKKAWNRQQLKNSSAEERMQLNEALKRILPFVAQSERFYSGIVMHINYASMRLIDQQYMLDQIVHTSNLDHTYSDYNFAEYLSCLEMNNQNNRINDLNNRINDLNNRINDLNNHINTLNNQIAGIISSRSWRLTKPLRILIQKIRTNKYTYLIAKGIKSLLCNGIGVTWKKMKNKLFPNERKDLLQAEYTTIRYRFEHALRNYGLWGTMKKAIKKVIQKIYIVSRRYNWMQMPLKLIKRVVQKLFPKLRNKLDQSLYQAKIHMYQRSAENGNYLNAVSNWSGERAIPFEEKPLVSVIVPNYNHSAYLRDRLESVYNQTYSNFEVILLDDCSTDNSREILMEYANRYPERTIVDFNEVNGGKVFKQWNKGFEHAKGKLIWVAESDDWCDLDFLEKMVPQFEYQSVMLAFCNSIFMQDGEKIWSLGEYLADIPALDFGKNFMMSAHTAVNTAFAIKNIVPNVSSAVFRNVGQIPSEITDIWKNIKLCGDWLFYLYTIKGGTISYTSETTNYYRVHKNSTSLKIQKTPEYYMEQEQISRYVVENYDVAPKIFDKVLRNLEQHYQVLNETEDATIVHENYSIDRIAATSANRRPSILMCGFSLQIGGGETYPIVLANEMKRQGITVTFLNFNMASYSEQIRGMLNPGIPVITLESPECLRQILLQTGADIVHSHHASVDTMLSIWLRTLDSKCKQVVTFHGMYETMESTNCRNSFETLTHTCKKIIYIADKNLTQLNALGYKDRFDLVKLGNGLPQIEVTPVKRSSLGIEENAFVFCIVSRALPQKGWKEAADAVIRANKTSPREIHLILVGDGEMREKLSGLNSRYVHLVGQRPNVRDYFAASDMGLLPSTYTGESFPLVVIECMLTGNPVLSSNLGEVKYQLTAGDGNLAGMLIELNDWKLDVDELSAMMVQLANDNALYQQLRSRVPSASKKFDISRIVKQHIEIYESVRK